MEIKSYVEALLRKWWLIGLILVLSFWLGGIIGNSQQSTYTASTTIVLNSQLLSDMADPSNVVHLRIPASYTSQVVTPAILNTIVKHYPRLSHLELQKNIAVASDTLNNFLSISVTDISPASAADIANYLAQEFVKRHTKDLERQLDYYLGWLQQNISQLNQEINKLNLELQNLIPPPTLQRDATPIDAATRQKINTDEFQLYLDERDLYNYQQALQNTQNIRPLVPKAYIIMQPATGSSVPTSVPLSTTLIQLVAVVVGLFAAICLVIVIEYFSPFVRHKGELQRIVGLPVLTELPNLSNAKQRRLLESQPLFFHRQMNALRLWSTAIGAPAMKHKGYTLLLTSPRRKRNLAAVLATFLARTGHRTLLIDADFKNPRLHEQVKPVGTCDIVTSKGWPLSFIKKTENPHLFVLPSTAMLGPNEPLAITNLIDLLPELQNVFSVIIIDAPPLDHADTHLLAPRAMQTVLLVKKRRDSLKKLKQAHVLCEKLKLNVYGVLLG